MESIGLAETRKKKRFTLNPRGTLWANDQNKVGQRLLEKMGWEKGKGLGKDAQGISEPISAVCNQESRGMGYKGNTEDWVVHYDAFENVLADLNKASNSGSSNEKSDPNSEVENSAESLEQLSKNSRNRVHYKKFTRGKDLSRYTEDDLACVLGSKRPSKKQNMSTEEKKEKLEVGEIDKSFGITSVHGGSLKDYFSKKMEELKKKREEGIIGRNVDENATPDATKICLNTSTTLPDLEFEPARTDFSFSVELEEETVIEEEIVCSIEPVESSKKKKRKKKKKDQDNSEEESKNDRKLKKSSEIGDGVCGNVETNVVCDDGMKSKRKKNKKRKNYVDVDKENCKEEEEESKIENKKLCVEGEILKDNGSKTKKKNKRKVEVSTEEVEQVDRNAIKKKKKRDKKTSNEVSVRNNEENDIEDSVRNNTEENDMEEDEYLSKENEENENKEMRQGVMNMSYVAATCVEGGKRKKKKRDVDGVVSNEKPLKKLKKLASELSLVDIFKGGSDAPGDEEHNQQHSNENDPKLQENEESEKPKKKLRSKHSFKEIKTQIEYKFKKKSKKGLDSIEERTEDLSHNAENNADMSHEMQDMSCEKDVSDMVTLSVPQRHLKKETPKSKYPVKDITCNIQELYPGSNIASVKGYST